MSTNHIVKSWPEFFAPVASGKKTFEIRNNDRKYQVGDMITLREFDDRLGKYTGEQITKLITYVMVGGGSGSMPPLAGLSRDYAILALADIPK